MDRTLPVMGNGWLTPTGEGSETVHFPTDSPVPMRSATTTAYVSARPRYGLFDVVGLLFRELLLMILVFVLVLAVGAAAVHDAEEDLHRRSEPAGQRGAGVCLSAACGRVGGSPVAAAGCRRGGPGRGQHHRLARSEAAGRAGPGPAVLPEAGQGQRRSGRQAGRRRDQVHQRRPDHLDRRRRARSSAWASRATAPRSRRGC